MLTDGHEANKHRVFLVNNVVHQSIGIGQVSPIFYQKSIGIGLVGKSDIGHFDLNCMLCWPKISAHLQKTCLKSLKSSKEQFQR